MIAGTPPKDIRRGMRIPAGGEMALYYGALEYDSRSRTFPRGQLTGRFGLRI